MGRWWTRLLLLLPLAECLGRGRRSGDDDNDDDDVNDVSDINIDEECCEEAALVKVRTTMTTTMSATLWTSAEEALTCPAGAPRVNLRDEHIAELNRPMRRAEDRHEQLNCRTNNLNRWNHFNDRRFVQLEESVTKLEQLLAAVVDRGARHEDEPLPV